MKIIAKSANGKLLVEMNEQECGTILGEFLISSENITKSINTSIDYPVSKIYHRYKTVQSLVLESEYHKARTKLQQMLNALTPIESLLNELNKISDEK